MKILGILKVRHLGEHRLYREFNNAEAGEVDLPSDRDGPIFKPLQDTGLFARVKLEGGTVAWPNGADLAPEYLISRLVRQGVPSHA